MGHKIYRSLAVSLAASAIVCGCALVSQTQFRPWTGNKPMVGSGGVVTNLSGFEYWEHGAPTRPFQILGVIEQDSISSPILTLYNRDEIAKRLRAIGADGVILLKANQEISGFTIDKSGPYYTASPTKVEHSALAAFRYLRVPPNSASDSHTR
jgi:hypothetical protein